jgi:hypothetical protein
VAEEATIELLFGPLFVVPATTPSFPSVGSAALGSTDHPPAVELGQTGAVVCTVFEYCDNGTPVGVMAAHCCWRLVKSGAMGVGDP